MKRFNSIADLTSAAKLSEIVGPIVQVNTELLSGIGFSGSLLNKVEVLLETGEKKVFILKQTRLQDDWLSLRSRDTIGREAALLGEEKLARIWDIIQCPYVAFAQERHLAGLLMNDLSNYLFPDEREPISISEEDTIINGIACIHAMFWDSADIKEMDWLAGPLDYLSILGPGKHDEDKICAPPEKIKIGMEEGWELGLQLLSPGVRNLLVKPANEIFERWKDLPATLLHGDLKIANMAILPGGKLALFDWPTIGYAPAAIELGWYLAVNATRIAKTKEQFINKYRAALESNLHCEIEETAWEKMKRLAVIAGARMLLWNKALGWRSGTQKGKDEWQWWNDQLEAAVKVV